MTEEQVKQGNKIIEEINMLRDIKSELNHIFEDYNFFHTDLAKNTVAEINVMILEKDKELKEL